MYYKTFHDLRISALGQGGLRFPSLPGQPNVIDRAGGQAVVDEAIRAGINYFDTAYTYQNGDSERFLGEALRRYPRESYYLASKYNAAANPDPADAFAKQRERLGVDFFDFYLLHCLDENSFRAYTDREKDYLGYFLRQKEAGRIRYLGFSSHASPATLEKFLDFYDGFDMALIQLNYLDWTLLDAREQYEILTRRGIPVWVMEPMKGGRLASLNEGAAALLRAAAPERSVASWGFRFLMGLPNVYTVLSGMSTVEQVRDNAATFARWDPLSPEEERLLQAAKDAYMGDLGVPCSACRYCCDTCPAQLDIPMLIRGYNEHSVTGKTWRVVQLESGRSARECLQCGTCLTHCPQRIDIPAVMRKMAAL